MRVASISWPLLLLLLTAFVSMGLGELSTRHGLLSEKVINVGQNCQGDEVHVTVAFLRERLGEVDMDADLSEIFQGICKGKRGRQMTSYIETLVTDMFIIREELGPADLYDWTFSVLTLWAWFFLMLLYAIFVFAITKTPNLEGPLQLLLFFIGLFTISFFFFWVYNVEAIYSLSNLPAMLFGLAGALLTHYWNYITPKDKRKLDETDKH